MDWLEWLEELLELVYAGKTSSVVGMIKDRILEYDLEEE